MKYSDPGTTRSSLLERIKAREPQAWEKLTTLYGPLVYGWCRRSGLPQSDVPDVMQEVFAAVLVSLDRFRRDQPGDSFRAWLRGITRNKLAAHFRRRGREPIDSDQLDQLPAPDGSSASSAGSDEEDAGALQQRIFDLVKNEFEETTWLACRMVVVEGRSPAQVARELGITPNAVYIAKSRVLARIREELGELMG